MPKVLPPLSKARKELLVDVARYDDTKDSERHRYSDLILGLRGNLGREEYRGESDDGLWTIALQLARDYGLVQDTDVSIREAIPTFTQSEVYAEKDSIKSIEEDHRDLEQSIAQSTNPDAKEFYAKLLRLQEKAVTEQAKRPYIQHLVDVLTYHMYHSQ